MKTMSVGHFKTQFSKVLQRLKEGQKVMVTYGKKKEVVGYFIPPPLNRDQDRQLGLMEGKASAVFLDDFKITEEEFLQ